jgi:hypothetical protein
MFLGALLPALWVLWSGEAFLAVTKRVPADVLLVEGWIGKDAFNSAAEELQKGDYRFVVTTGALTSKDWNEQRYSYAEIAARELRNAGIPQDRILVAQAPEVDERRTFASAVAAHKALASHGITPRGINVFTRGMHARRSRLVNDKLHDVPVGVIGWMPEQDRRSAWWHSSERTKDFLTESFAYLFEAVLNSGRWSNKGVDFEVPPMADGLAEQSR